MWQACAAAPVFLILLLATSCGHTSESPEEPVDNPEARLESLLRDRRSSGTLTFFSAASRLQNRSDEKDMCLWHASIQAARYFSLEGSVVFFTQSSGNQTGYVKSIEINDDTELAKGLSQKLLPLEILQTHEGTFGLFELQDGSKLQLALEDLKTRNPPLWIGKIPEIEGYYVGVGVVSRSRRILDSIENADKAALYEVLAQISLNVRSGTGETSALSGTITTIQTGLEKASGRLTGFYILDRWVTEDGNSYYSLAICPTAQNI